MLRLSWLEKGLGLRVSVMLYGTRHTSQNKPKTHKPKALQDVGGCSSQRGSSLNEGREPLEWSPGVPAEEQFQLIFRI